MSPPLWSQMSILTTFLGHVIIPSFDPLKSIHCHSPMYRPYKVNDRVGAYCLMINVSETRVPSYSSEDLSRTLICLAIVQTVYYNVKKRVWMRAVLCQEVSSPRIYVHCMVEYTYV